MEVFPMNKILILSASLLLPVCLTAQTPPAPAQTQTKHKAAKVRHCAECNMDFKTTKEAKEHYAKVHGMKFYCAHCDKAFKTKAEMSAHKKECLSKKASTAQPPM
jgi:uncharacterized C2H2 Zn-finger protein